MKRKISNIIIILIFLVGLGVFFYPIITNKINNKKKIIKINNIKKNMTKNNKKNKQTNKK